MSGPSARVGQQREHEQNGRESKFQFHNPGETLFYTDEVASMEFE
jgi:hypothetical protein